MIRRFFRDVKRFNKYALYSAKANLKTEVANSYLNWLWWILDPLCFMLIYTFVFGVVFNSKEDFFTVFIFIGLTLWNFFSKTVNQSVRLVKMNKSIVSKVYIPKFMLVLVRMYVNGFKMLISLVIIVIMILAYRVPITWNVLYIIPVLLTLFVLTFGISTILLHFGVFVEDLSNVTNLVLRLLFYLTGIFYDVQKKLKRMAPLDVIAVRVNPMAFLLASARGALLYGQTPHRKILLLWFVISVLISALGVRLIYKNENSYVKVI